jgi:hypothetical protein
MSFEQQSYHRHRERQCRSMAESASDPEIRRRHEQLAELHAGRAAEPCADGSDARYTF